MALENQPVFRAPSLPKMGKTTVSSSVFSNVAKSSYKPKLRSTKFKFVSPLQKQQAEKSEGLKTQIQGSAVTANVSATLEETNRILVEIQKQLALDFANRITEKKQLLESSRRSTLKQKAVKKEAFVEKGKNLTKVILAPFEKVIAPAKSIFDKLLEFVTVVGGGILLNTAWDWLSKKENRDKLEKVFNFLADNWKLLLAIGIGVKLLGVVRTIKTAFSLLGGAIKLLGNVLKRLRRPPKPPEQPPRGKGGGTPPGGCPPPNCFGGPVTEILKEKFKDRNFIDNILVPAIIGAGFVRGKPTPIEVPTPPTPVPVYRPVLPDGTPAPFGPEEQVFDDPASGIFDYQIPDFIKFFSKIPRPGYMDPLGDNYNEFLTMLSVFAPALGYGGLRALPALKDVSSMFGRGALNRASRQSPISLGQGTSSKTGASTAGRSIPKTSPSTAISDIAKIKFQLKSKPFDQLVRIARGKGPEGLDSGYRKVAQDLLEEIAKGKGSFGKANAGNKRIAEDILKDIVSIGQRLSQGGTVFGQGSGMVDSIRAMLAPGEEVIRTASAKLFRPLLKDINDNAGRMWIAFSNAIKLQSKNNERQKEVNVKFEESIVTLNDYFKKMLQKKRKKELKDILEGRPTITLGGPRMPTTSPNSLKVSAKQKQSPSTIKTYNVKKRSSSNGQPTIINMPMPAISLAGNQSPEAPNTNVQESSSAPISIISFDSENPYISEAFASYGIFI